MSKPTWAEQSTIPIAAIAEDPMSKADKDIDGCRFGFSHDIVENSHFESDMNSIIFASWESDVNGHNPIFLVYTCLNYDLKCILSGKAAKAAMFYISSYTTKMLLKAEQLLSLPFKAVALIDISNIFDTRVGSAHLAELNNCMHNLLLDICNDWVILWWGCLQNRGANKDWNKFLSCIPLLEVSVTWVDDFGSSEDRLCWASTLFWVVQLYVCWMNNSKLAEGTLTVCIIPIVCPCLFQTIFTLQSITYSLSCRRIYQVFIY